MSKRIRINEGEAEGLTGHTLNGPTHEGADGKERVAVILDNGALISVPQDQIREGEKKTFGFGKSK